MLAVKFMNNTRLFDFIIIKQFLNLPKVFRLNTFQLLSFRRENIACSNSANLRFIMLRLDDPRRFTSVINLIVLPDHVSLLGL